LHTQLSDDNFASQAYDSVNDRYKVNAEVVANPPNLDLALTSLRDELLGGTATYPGGIDDVYNRLGTLDSRLYNATDELSAYDQLKQIRAQSDSYLPNIDVPVSTLLRIRAYEQGFEDGTTDLTAENCTQTVQSTEVYGGDYALDVAIADGVTGSVTTPTRTVSADQRVTFSYAHKENAYISEIKLIVIWRRSAGGIIDTEEYTLTPTTSWQVDSRTLTAPKNATSMELKMQARETSK